MPEGDTIYRAARALQRALGGKVVTGFETGLAKLARVNDDAPVVGRVVERVEARGKWCLIYFSGDLILTTHMLMSGSWHLYRTGERWRMPRRAMRVVIRVGADGGETPAAYDPAAAAPTHAMEPHEWGTRQGLTPLVPEGGLDSTAEAVPLQQRGANRGVEEATAVGAVCGTEGFEAVAFNVPVAEFYTARGLERSSQVPKLGPDVLADGFSVEAGVRALRDYGAAHPEAEIAVVLLNQRVMAGLGNVYKSEVAFAAGVNPFRQMRTIAEREMEKMVEASQRYMKANVADGAGDGIVTYAGNRRTTRSMNAGGRLWVYGRQGQECRRCGAVVEMRKQGEAVRSTYWCPACQPWMAAEGQSEAAPVGRKVKLTGPRRKVGC